MIGHEFACDVSCKLSMVYLKCSCHEVSKLHVPHDKRIQTKGRKFAAPNSLDKKLKGQCRALYTFFSLFSIIKVPTGKLRGFRLFSQPQYTELDGKLRGFRRFSQP